jgi:hypothetical protein
MPGAHRSGNRCHGFANLAVDPRVGRGRFAFLHKDSSHILNGLNSTIHRIGDLHVVPTWTVGICLEQNHCSAELFLASLLSLDRCRAGRALRPLQPHHVLLVHQNLLVKEEIPQKSRLRQPQHFAWTKHYQMKSISISVDVAKHSDGWPWRQSKRLAESCGRCSFRSE